MTCAEMIEVIEATTPMADDQKNVLRALKPYIKDAQNKLSLVVFFKFSDDKEEAEEILRDAIVVFEPETPPEEAIQVALRAIGCCPAGFLWVPTLTGYRCAAGGHFCSHEKIQAYLASH